MRASVRLGRLPNKKDWHILIWVLYRLVVVLFMFQEHSTLHLKKKLHTYKNYFSFHTTLKITTFSYVFFSTGSLAMLVTVLLSAKCVNDNDIML